MTYCLVSSFVSSHFHIRHIWLTWPVFMTTVQWQSISFLSCHSDDLECNLPLLLNTAAKAAIDIPLQQCSEDGGREGETGTLQWAHNILPRDITEMCVCVCACVCWAAQFCKSVVCSDKCMMNAAVSRFQSLCCGRRSQSFLPSLREIEKTG